MKEKILDLLDSYLKIFPEERDRQQELIKFLNKNINIIDRNNFNGHIVAGGFIYAKKERKFLVVYNKKLNRFLHPGGHVEDIDKNPLDAAKREILEESGLTDLKLIKMQDNDLLPIDIDTHIINYNEKLKMPQHFHFEFRYLFETEKIRKVIINEEEIDKFQWVDIEKIRNNKSYDYIIPKIEKILGL